MLYGEPNVKQFYVVICAVLTVFALSTASVKANSSDNWNVTVTTGPGQPTMPLNSTGFLSLENFTVVSTGQISDLTFNSSVSELGFWENFTTSDGYIDTTGFNTIIYAPVQFFDGNTLNNQTLLVFVNVDGRGNGYFFGNDINSNSFGFCLRVGQHYVTYDIGVIVQPSNNSTSADPSPTIPEFGTATFLVCLLTVSLVYTALQKKRRACFSEQRYNQRALTKNPTRAVGYEKSCRCLVLSSSCFVIPFCFCCKDLCRQ